MVFAGDFPIASLIINLVFHSGTYNSHWASRFKTSPCYCTWKQELWSLVQVFALQSYSNSGLYFVTVIFAFLGSSFVSAFHSYSISICIYGTHSLTRCFQWCADFSCVISHWEQCSVRSTYRKWKNDICWACYASSIQHSAWYEGTQLVSLRAIVTSVFHSSPFAVNFRFCLFTCIRTQSEILPCSISPIIEIIWTRFCFFLIVFL